ncbi:MAG: glycerol-3-phosphate dehydrogenase/oxidase [Gemmatimonadaceae bacterium]|nr:glycerol-3-phosphate dehydrogenase/oxidase [Gemmatimonadaceae bacterium]
MPSAFPRPAVSSLESGQFDLLVIGGGITGCGIARDAVLRGLRVALVEKADFASGTSSRSSRLVHGGVRYLEHGHLRLVFEASVERRLLLALAPHLVRPLAFTWPVYADARVPRWKLVAGLTLYDALALFRNVARHRWLRSGETALHEPHLRSAGLHGAAVYYDAATDDSRLTLVNALDAIAAGATVLNHVRCDALLRDGAGRVEGASVTDVLTGRTATVRAHVVAQAIGPWTGGTVRGSTGVHITVPRDRVGNAGALTLTAPSDGRVMFTLPAGSHTIIGTTETPTTSAPDEVRATEADVRYLLDAVNHFFPEAHLTREDVVTAWAGVRPLVQGSGSLGSASREHHVAQEPGLLTITGGKLTTYRVMAADVVNATEKMLGRKVTKSPTLERALHGGELPDVAAEVERVRRDTGLSAGRAAHLIHSYGSHWPHVWGIALAMRDGASPVVPGLPYLVAEIPHAARAERACTVGDVLIRRTHLAFELPDQGRSIAPRIAALMAPELGWDAAQQGLEVVRYAEEAERMFAIEPL